MKQIHIDAVRAEARRWVGTPWVHNQSCAGGGTDCVGLVLGIYKNLGMLPVDYRAPNYSQQWHAHKNEELMLEGAYALGFLDRDNGESPRPGDVLGFRFGRVVSHTGLMLTDGAFIHAYYALHRVVVQPLAGDLQRRLVRILKPPFLVVTE